MNKPELLAPAGTPAAALAALDAGADAIYAGLSRFNARERGENFTPEAMAKVIEHFHRHGKKVYVTFNTLLKEQELPDAFEQLALLNSLRPDALLVQDLGVIRMAREYFPDLNLHSSTQMEFHNSAGLAVAEKLGVSRVVLERQVTLDELKLIKSKTNLEIELFIHGALCCSLSGICFFSSYLGGYSGNRGKCKQPCRRRYFSEKGNGFFFSTQDLCAIELIPEFRRLGIASLKIEGRLRQTDYVTAAVSAYRMLIDTPDEEFSAAIPKARKILSEVGGRRWSHGFYTPDAAKTIIRADAMGSTGKLCGSVQAVSKNGFEFTTSTRLFIGDRIRIQPANGEEGPALAATKFFVDNKSVNKVMPGQRVFVCCDKTIPQRGQVFRLGGSLTDYSKMLAALPEPRTSLDLDITLTAGEIKVVPPAKTDLVWKKTLSLSPAKSRSASAEQVAEEFKASDSPLWGAGTIRATVEPGLFLPASELKQLRREAWEFFKENLTPDMVVFDPRAKLEAFRRDYQALKGLPVTDKRIETAALRARGEEPASRKCYRGASVFELASATGEAILPEFMPETKLPMLERAIRKAYDSGIRRFRVPSLYGAELLKDYPDIEITFSAPLPVANSQAVLMAKELGATRSLAHIELDKESLSAMREKSVLDLELYRLGRPVLLVTRGTIPAEGEIRDARNIGFLVRYDSKSGLTRLYPKKIHSIPRLPGFHDFFDLTMANWNAEDTDSFNFERELS
ncbi:MAG: U32 family peptidase [Lentisphaeria bacterium]|nr:U32 family peptidase [Lentisphaeria bacterium]